MRVLVLGAGIIGVTTAHYLAEDGHEVAVIDRQIGPALETSFGNAGNVYSNYATPWAAPGMRWKALKRLLQDDAPLRVDWRADAAFVQRCPAWLGTPVQHLFLKVGHGAQGWSMACGSGRLLARLVVGLQPGIDLEGLTLERCD